MKYPCAPSRSSSRTGEFIRIHRSFVVPEKRIAKFSSTEVVLSKCGKRLPVGKTYSEAAMAVLSREKVIFQALMLGGVEYFSLLFVPQSNM